MSVYIVSIEYHIFVTPFFVYQIDAQTLTNFTNKIKLSLKKMKR